MLPNKICWRKLDGTRIAGLDRSLLHDGGYEGDALTVLGLGELSEICVEELKKKGQEIRWNEKVVALGGQEEGSTEAWVEVETAEGKKRYEGDFVVGCDGGNSAVRKLLFGKRFDGFTWDVQVVATNVGLLLSSVYTVRVDADVEQTYYDISKFGWEETNFIINNDHWYMAALISNDGLWRISYGEQTGFTDEELLKRQPLKFEQMLPGNPKPSEYKIASISPYKVHQRCAEKMAVGRVALAADAAHLCNPFGGMGLTGGIVDVEGLFECLRGIHAGVADLSILEKYSEVRIEKYQTIVNPVSSSNIVRLSQLDPETALEKDPFLQTVKKAETDFDLSKEMQTASNKLKYDFTQHYTRPIDG